MCKVEFNAVTLPVAKEMTWEGRNCNLCVTAQVGRGPRLHLHTLKMVSICDLVGLASSEKLFS